MRVLAIVFASRPLLHTSTWMWPSLSAARPQPTSTPTMSSPPVRRLGQLVSGVGRLVRAPNRERRQPKIRGVMDRLDAAVPRGVRTKGRGG